MKLRNVLALGAALTLSTACTGGGDRASSQNPYDSGVSSGTTSPEPVTGAGSGSAAETSTSGAISSGTTSDSATPTATPGSGM